MHRALCLLVFVSTCAYAADTPPTAPIQPAIPTNKPQPSVGSNAKFLYSIDPKQRSADFMQAYDLLRREKPTFKISLRIANAMILANIVDLTAASAGTLLFVKVPSNTGPRTVVVPVEEVIEIFYSPQ